METQSLSSCIQEAGPYDGSWSALSVLAIATLFIHGLQVTLDPTDSFPLFTVRIVSLLFLSGS